MTLPTSNTLPNFNPKTAGGGGQFEKGFSKSVSSKERQKP